ncbi:chitinase domain-containing protein 1 isoform X2 [Scaptodrosophila lebanonensis]|uniref:Chitinase domain-containing protein 1 n=1 Tax=Drosophila lebanonensis TaxID=7225 RepID=A0A6J2U028_DROLE|nr:chitinase domain-containing protein 1 isoform X2 [Scaptodrosophila lebanonensis]
MPNFKTLAIFLFMCLSCCRISLSTISPNSKGKQKEIKLLSGPQDKDVFELKLISEEPLATDIIVHNEAYYKDTKIRRFNGTALGYVTPWNSHGYDIAKIFAKKFDIISPVWLQIVKKKNNYTLAGTHDVDASWLSDVRRKGKVQMPQQRAVKIFPRVIFDYFTDSDIKLLLSDAQERSKLNNELIRGCQEYGFDGVVLEVWSQLAGRIDDNYLYALVLQMAKDLEKQRLQLILVIPPYRKEMPNLFGEKHMERLPGANSPLYWARRAIELIAPDGCHDVEEKRRKILMGLNMYGNDYTPDGGTPITYSKYLELIRHVKKHLTYDERDVENFFEVKTQTGRHIVFYPTLHSIHERIKLAQELGVGVSLWELGQGLNYFYDLF